MGKTFVHIYAQFDQCGTNLSRDLDNLLDLGLICDGTTGLNQAKQCRAALQRLQNAGGIIAPNIYPADIDPACANPNWWAYPLKECKRLLKCGLDRFESAGFSRPFAVNTYTPGNHFVQACRELGIRYIFGFCAPIIIEDGPWRIAHYGSPLSPYFISDEDFRKPEAPGTRPDPIMMVSMELRNPLVCLRHWSEGPWCPLNAQAADRWLEPGEIPLPFETIAEDWIREAEWGDQDNFFHINLQYFFAGACRDHNIAALKFLARLLKKGRIQNGSIREWGARMLRSGGFVEQNTLWSGELPGFQVGNRPGFFPDTFVSENLERQSIWEFPKPVPERFYDYRKKWECAPFQRDGSDPAPDDLSGITAVFHTEGSGERRIVTLSVHNRGESKKVPLMDFSAFSGLCAPFTAENKNVKIVPHPSGNGAALLVEREWPTGTTEIKFAIAGQKTGILPSVKHFGTLLEARTFSCEEKTYSVLCSLSTEKFSVKVRVRRKSQLESMLGSQWTPPHPVQAEEIIPLGFDGTRQVQYHRFHGIRADEIEVIDIAGVEEMLRKRTRSVVKKYMPGFSIPEPGYQLLGSLRQKDRWDLPLGRKAGELERVKINKKLRQFYPNAGEFLIEAHPGLLIPRGSITKALGHVFDVIQVQEPYCFRELAADYPQAWDWGVAGWVHWSDLSFELKGLDPALNYMLYFHAVDPEIRHVVQQISFISGSRTITPVKEWRLPEGVESRFSPEAFCAVPLPEECRTWEKIKVRIVSPSPFLYHWIREHGVPGMLFHFWMTAAKNEINPGES